MTRLLIAVRDFEPSAKALSRVAIAALIIAMIAGGATVSTVFGLREQQRKTNHIANQAQRTSAEACWRSKVGGPIIARRLYERFDVFADPELYRWYVGAIPTKCQPLPEHLLPPARYR